MKKAKKSGGKPRQPKKDIWSISGLVKRVQTLIEAGALIRKNGEDYIVSTINAEFAEQIAAEKGIRQLSRTALHKRLDELIGTPRVNADLWKCHHTKWMLDEFRAMYPYIPEDWIRRQLSARKGITKTESVAAVKAGMGRVDTSDLPRSYRHYRFPDNSFRQPLVISKASEGQLPVINGALVGIKYPDIEANPLRRALADARKRGADAVVLTNLIDLWTKRTAGYLAVYRAVVSGIKINPDRFEDKEYARIVRDILDKKITEKMIYMTLAQRLEEVLDGLHKITHRQRNQGPEFPGPVFILLGLMEEEIINAIAYYEARYWTLTEQADLRSAVSMANSKLTDAKKRNDYELVKKCEAKRESLLKRLAACIISNHTGPQYEAIRLEKRAYLVWRLESIIPNAKVIGQRDAHLRCGPHSVKLKMPSDSKVRDSHLADLGDKYGADLFRDELADLTMTCPPHSLNHRSVGREDSKDGQPVTKFLAVASSCLDGEFLREEFKDTQKAAHPVQELVYSSQFKPGVTILTWSNGLLSMDDLPIERLGRFTAPKDMANFAYPYPGLEHITIFCRTDEHFGAPDKRFVFDPVNGMTYGVSEGLIEMMRRCGIVNGNIPVHMTHSMDDLTNGDMWFRPGYRPDPNRMRTPLYQRWQHELTRTIERAVEKGDKEGALRLLNELRQVSIAQLHLHGEEFPFHQMEQVFQLHIEPNVDFYSAVLSRWVKSGCSITGISEINRNIVDTRDVGVHNFPTGNHRIRTLDQKDLEGPYVAWHLRNLLAQRPEWRRYEKAHPGFLSNSVRAPRFGGSTYGWGLVEAPDGFKWGMRMLGSPARQQGWSDIVGASIKSDIARGDDTYGLLKYVTVTFFGDKHFYAKALTERISYFMCAAGVHTNHYGSDGGFPPNNTGPMFVSIPVDGPQSGPIIVRVIPHDFIRDWFAKPTEFNWDKFLPKPA